ncbi:MAG: hypothetical protein CMC15_15360, partial [Flavobacteriaceae bacterium]|nr:hypothetical protein [Flavobacteriaceae bacterium]
MGRVMIISDILDSHKPLIEEAYGHVWDTMGNLLLKRRGKQYFRFGDKQDYLDYEFNMFKQRMLKLWRNGTVSGWTFEL